MSIPLSLLGVWDLKLSFFSDTWEIKRRETTWPLRICATSLLLATQDRSQATALFCQSSRLLRVFCLVHRLGHWQHGIVVSQAGTNGREIDLSILICPLRSTLWHAVRIGNLIVIIVDIRSIQPLRGTFPESVCIVWASTLAEPR